MLTPHDIYCRYRTAENVYSTIELVLKKNHKKPKQKQKNYSAKYLFRLLRSYYLQIQKGKDFGYYSGNEELDYKRYIQHESNIEKFLQEEARKTKKFLYPTTPQAVKPCSNDSYENVKAKQPPINEGESHTPSDYIRDEIASMFDKLQKHTKEYYDTAKYTVRDTVNNTYLDKVETKHEKDVFSQLGTKERKQYINLYIIELYSLSYPFNYEILHSKYRK